MKLNCITAPLQELKEFQELAEWVKREKKEGRRKEKGCICEWLY